MGNKFKRQSHRLYGWDYRTPGPYFITMCTKNREIYFENVNVRNITDDYIRRLPKYFSHIDIDEYVIMPNHVHMIINIKKWPGHETGSNNLSNSVRRGETIQSGRPDSVVSPLRQVRDTVFPKPSELDKKPVTDNNRPFRPNGTPSGSIGAIAGKCKSLISRKCNIRFGKWKIAWQRDYWDHIIHNENEYHNISQYIQNNPKKWAQDRNNPQSKSFLPKDEQINARLDWYLT